MQELTVFIFILSISLPCFSQVAPTFVTSNFVQAEKIMAINGDGCNCITTSGSPMMTTLTFATAFAATPNLGYGISSLQRHGKLFDLQFDITRAALSSSFFKFKLQIFGTTKIWNFEIRYIAISAAFPHHLNSFESVPVSYNSVLSNITVESSSNQTYINIVNYTQQAASIGSTYQTFSTPLTNNKILLFISSFYYTSADPTQNQATNDDDDSDSDNDYINLKISATPISTSSYKFYVSLAFKVVINKLHFSMIVYDDADVKSSGTYEFVQNRIQFGPAGGFYNFPAQFLTNFMVGFIQFSTNSTYNSLQFKIQFNTASGTFGLQMPPSSPKLSLPKMSRFNYTTLYLKTWVCPAGTILDRSTNLCNSATCTLSNCITCASSIACSVCNEANGFFLNPTTQLCQTCPIQGCTTCLSFTVCSICDASRGYLINNSSGLCQSCALAGCIACPSLTNCTDCDEIANYVLLSNLTCLLCDQNLSLYADAATQTCVSCSLNECLTCATLTTCSLCNSSNLYYVDPSGVCQYCDPTANKFINPVALTCDLCPIANCITCSSLSQCSVCQLGFVLNSTTKLCDPCTPTTCQGCSITNCVSCPQSLTICELCVLGYEVVNNVCRESCGDFFKIGIEQCDDGNSLEYDGCSPSCKVEADFVCQPHFSNPFGSGCYYLGPIWIEVVYVQKINSLNKVEILLQYFPKHLLFWKEVDFTKIVAVQSLIPISGVEVVRNSNGTVLLSFYYGEDIQDENINIQITPANSGINSLSRTTPSTHSFLVKPDDNESAKYYDSSVYKMASIISLLCSIISAISLAFFILGLISGKMIGVEMMAVIQISFFGLISLTEMNPCFSALSSLRFVNGYNSLGSNPLFDRLTPTQARGIFLLSRFAENFNFTALIILVPLLVSLISLILWKTILKDNQRVEKVFKRSLGEYTLNGLLFSGYLVAVSFVLQMKYGIHNTDDLMGKYSLSECIICLTLMVVYFFLKIFKPQFFGEFSNSFDSERISSKHYYCYMLIQRLIVGTCLALMLQVNVEIILPMILFISTGVYILIKRPYRKNRHNIRVFVNMLIASIILAIYLSYRLILKEKKKEQQIFLFLPLLVCFLLIICVILNVGTMIYQFYRWLKKRNEFQQVGPLSKTQLDQNYNIMNSPTKQNIMKDSYVMTEQLKKSINLNEIKKQIRLEVIQSEPNPTLFKHTSFVHQQYEGEI